MIAELLAPVKLPKMIPIRQIFDDSALDEAQIRETMLRQMNGDAIAGRIRPGMRVAITAGSRGISNIVLILRTIVDYVRAQGGEPFVVPAMGSHGGATAEGQMEVLRSYNITEETMGCPIRASMETVVLGTTETGLPVHCDRYAAEADGIIVCGRIKVHTSFHGPYESGLCKMMAIGLGKQKGASILHRDGFGQMKDELPMFGRVFLKNAKILMGVGLIENAYDKTYRIDVLPAEEIMEKEPALLDIARGTMPRILFDTCDVLIVDQIGKNFSGPGMDPNITGRASTPYASGSFKAGRVAILDLSEESHGNACGCGLGDVTTRRLFDKMDFEKTYPNSITNTNTDVMKIPMVMENDKMALQLSIRSCNYADKENPRFVRIRNTLALGQIWISEAMLPEALENPQIEILGEASPFDFDEQGNLRDI